ncbi:hypothetical protein ACFFU1_14830 [Algibacter miyuki]|uniref:Uncharacterized protein n=1 Tax=Algibacter miyuki TaxID=1306933 RepID=A0ABV5H2Q3_9FLAO|nr:hypothetical protein [Algibacter miyuki]MDN3663862.1 hypothetical protein [Algibacter miyuki]
MPANKKHLSSPFQRFAKITAGFIGGYIVTQVFHMFLVVFWNAPNTLITIRYAGIILWTVLLVVAFLGKNGLKIWAIYLLISLVFLSLIYFK